ncbi:transmembrane protein 98 isoform X2 [Vanacampus margaritifer]
MWKKVVLSNCSIYEVPSLILVLGAVAVPVVAMETVVIVAIGVLATIFLASLAALVVVCRHRYCHPHHLLHHFDSKWASGPFIRYTRLSNKRLMRTSCFIRPTLDLISAMETQSELSELELDDVVITNPHIEAILENEDWIEDASGLVSHCIAILKICHTLTEKLVALTMGSGAKVKAPASLGDIITVAKRISPRVDDVVRSMYPPLDPILLDARATALLLSVSHLVLVTRNACHMSGSLDWIDQSLHAAEDHMVVLREAALASEPERGILNGAEGQREHAI